MRLSVHIERLVLDGLPVEQRQGVMVQAALEAELARLLTAGGIGDSLKSGAAIARLSAADIRLNGATAPADLGREIALSIYRGIGK